MLVVSGQGKAWIAYGFKSGMSRFDVTRHLTDNESLVVIDDELQTRAGPGDNRSKYHLTYCSTPQKLYLMRFRLDDSLEAFVKAKEKYEKRYGEATPLNGESNYRNPATWNSANIAFIWDLNDSETILLKHDSEGSTAEFQDLSVCQ